MKSFFNSKIPYLFAILFHFSNLSYAGTTPPKFIPIAINIEFLHSMRIASNDNVSKGELGILNVPEDIENEYLKGRKHVVVHTKNDDYYRGSLICVSKFGVYVYTDKSFGIVYLLCESIDWKRIGRSYGSVLWKAGAVLGTFFAFRNNEQSFDAIADGYYPENYLLKDSAGQFGNRQIVLENSMIQQSITLCNKNKIGLYIYSTNISC
jgi:hypothetical protein